MNFYRFFFLPFLIYFFEEKRDFLLSDNQKELSFKQRFQEKKALKKPTFRIAPLFPNGDKVTIREKKKLHPVLEAGCRPCQAMDTGGKIRVEGVGVEMGKSFSCKRERMGT